MKILICERNLVGFFSAVYHTYYGHRDAGLITSDPARITLFDEGVTVPADIALAEKVRGGIIRKVDSVRYAAGERRFCPGYSDRHSMYKEVIDAYLNSDPDKEQVLYEYIRLLLDHGRGVQDMYGNDAVMRFNDLLRQVRGERHRLEGFVRFQELDGGALYGHFTSDHDILEILTEELLPGYNTERFILHDVGRKKLIYYDGAACHKLLAPDGVDITLSEDESAFQRLWKQYFKSVSIDSRVNPRLQSHFLPKKYRHFMHEF